MYNEKLNLKWNLIDRERSEKKSKCCLYCNNAHCGKFLLLLMSAYENTNACKIFKLSNKASKCLSSSKKIDIYILDIWAFKNWTKFYQVLINYPLESTIIDILLNIVVCTFFGHVVIEFPHIFPLNFSLTRTF